MKNSNNKVLPNLSIEPDENIFFKNGLQWNNIPKLSVITGVNGSGKTKLLEKIDIKLKTDKREKEYFFKKYDDIPNIFEQYFDKMAKENQDRDFINKLKSLKKDFLEDRSARDRIKKGDPIAYYAVENAEKIYSVPFEKISEKDLDNFGVNYLREKTEEDFGDMKIESKFIRFAEAKIGFEAKSTYLDGSSKEERLEFINYNLKDMFGSGIPPWDIINDKLSQFGFKYKMLEPTMSGRYMQMFSTEGGRKIGFKNLSSGERIIMQLILWSYDITSNLKSNNAGKLLMMDEFDAHLNPSIAEMFIKVVKDILVGQFNMQVIMTTHSPSTVAYCDEDDLFWMENGQITQKNKYEIIEALTPGILTFRKDALLLLTKKDCIVFTEGSTDVEYIKIAAEKLNYKDILEKCEIIPAGDADKGKSYFNIFKNYKTSKNIIAIFDYDKKGCSAFDSINKGSESLNKISKDYNNNVPDLIPSKEFKNDNVCAILLPLNNLDYPDESEYGYHPIEFLFKKECLLKFNEEAIIDNNDRNSINNSYFFNPNPTNNIKTVKLKDSIKSGFAEYVKKNAESICFNNFIPLLDKIRDFIK